MSVPAAELVIVGHFDQPAGYATRRTRGSPSWLLMWTQAGAGLVEQAGIRTTAGPGDLVVLGSAAAQFYRTAPGQDRWRFWWVHFQPRPAWLPWLAPYALAPGCHVIHGVGHDRIEQALLRAGADARWTGHGPPAVPSRPAQPVVAAAAEARELVLGAVEEVLVLATAAARRPGTGDPRVRQVEALIAAEPSARHTVASLARAVALSPSRLAHLFSEQTGRTPMQAVREARVRHAARLLEVTDLDVGQVANASGFVSPFHFSRVFSGAFGLPPREYRRRLRLSSGL
ncbi:helix-turn-helix domain-containing protein [Nonomuraea africana]|uniref:AraC family transcriptional regulator of arabinose operon n=1 Tax=Nonomuraea africana TaxID=46171 RepID=A0ABR9KG49_9ACTN|nr:helix-turn-helix domain-containing protein [Nonomuraea africana]MBE1560986.1 AraC family transcriptional regulator of arabinose operon [Nonomuraea africana]